MYVCMYVCMYVYATLPANNRISQTPAINRSREHRIVNMIEIVTNC